MRAENFFMEVKPMLFRRATSYDDARQIARLLYHGNIPVHEYWGGNETDFVNLIEPWLYAKGFLYYYKNLFIATEEHDRYPLAIVAGLEYQGQFDYTILGDKRSELVSSLYIEDIKGLRAILPEDEMVIINACLDPGIKDNNIGYDLLIHYMWAMRKRGFNSFRLDCDTKNTTAIKEYEKLGFYHVGESMGFSMTDKSIRLANLCFSF